MRGAYRILKNLGAQFPAAWKLPQWHAALMITALLGVGLSLAVAGASKEGSASTAVVSNLDAGRRIVTSNETANQGLTKMNTQPVSDEQLPERKRTTLGLYVTAAQAYEKWKAAPEKVKIIDVRTPEEFAFVGHPEMAWNIPLAFVTYQRKDGKTEYKVQMNPDFVDEVKKLAGPTDTLLVACRSGDRSAMAVNRLATAGFENTYTIIDGIEGDKVEDKGSVFYGKRMRNGWKNSAPWVYGFDPERITLKEGAINKGVQ
jgi:rhodanese-related sulfurtransferase